MARLRAAAWALALGVFSVVVAAALLRAVPLPGLWPALLLVVCSGVVAALAALAVELPDAAGAAGGAVAVLLVAAILGAAIAAAPLAPGGTRPGLRALLGKPLAALLLWAAICAAAGFTGVRGGRRLSRRLRARR